nr:hypothetical protein [Nonomuraea deserti]
MREDYARGLPLLAEFVAAARRVLPDVPADTRRAVPDLPADTRRAVPDLPADTRRALPDLPAGTHRWRPGDEALTMAWGAFCAMIIGADAAATELAQAEVARCRRHGLVGALPQVLQDLAGVHVQEGRHRDAEASVAEAVQLVRDIGLEHRVPRLNSVLARVAAIEGDEERCLRLAGNEPNTGGMAGTTALSLLDLGLGRHAAALDRLEAAARGPLRHASGLVSAGADQVEAAVRLGAPERAAEPLRRLEAWARAGGQRWAQAVSARCRAIVTDDEAHYLRALEAHEGAGRPFEQARTPWSGSPHKSSRSSVRQPMATPAGRSPPSSS